LERLRYVTPHPKDMGPEDVAAFAELPQLCPRLHLPLQAGSDAVLKSMRRRYDSAAFLRLVDELRAARPDLALSTDLIVAFPGETEEDFQNTLDMMRACNFMSSFSFIYSDRPGARAALFPDKIAPDEARDRLLRLQALQDELGARWLQARVKNHNRTTLLLEGPSPKPGDNAEPSWQGRDPYGVPVHVPLPAGTDHTGRLVQAVITEAKKHSLLAVRTGEPW
ncbi:radical SAM protein, partial [Desulfovibrio sp. 1188_IL3213]